MGPAHVVGRATYRTLEQVADAFLQDAVRRKPDRVLDAFRAFGVALAAPAFLAGGDLAVAWTP